MTDTVELDYCPYEYQELIHFSDKRFNLIVGGRRVGKSKLACMELIKHCLETPYATAWWVAPTFSMAREIGWNEFKEYEEALAPAIATVHETLLRVRFTNGSVLYFKSADNERSLRGRGLTYLVMDEAAFIDPEMWSRALFPALTDRKGKALLISTPNGRNWFYEMTMVADSREDWGVYHWPTHMNPLITEEDLRLSAQTVSEMDFRQEFLAEFVTKAGMVYDDFGPDNIVDPGLPSAHDWDIYLGMDFGYANPTAVCFMAVSEEYQRVVMFDELYVVRKSIQEIEHLIVLKLMEYGLEPHDVTEVYTDPAGNAEELSSGLSPVDFLRMGDYRWRVKNKGTEIFPGLALVRSFIKDATGDRSFFITSNCKEAIRSMFGYTYEKRSAKNETVKEEASKDGIHDHMCDAIRYFFVNRFDQHKWLAETPEQYVYGVDTSRTRLTMKRCSDCHRQFPSKTPKHQPPFKCKECVNGNIVRI